MAAGKTDTLRISRDLALPLDLVTEATAVVATRGAGKRLSLDTPLPTADGWTTMGEVQVGDLLFDELGQPARVTWVGEIAPGDSYVLTFSDDSEITADAEHLWLTWDKAARTRENNLARASRVGVSDEWIEKRPQCQPRSWTVPQVRTTAEIKDTLRYGPGGREANHAIRNALPLELPERELSLDPYVLGVWLGDGTRGTGCFTSMDEEIVGEVGKFYGVHRRNTLGQGRASTYRVDGLCAALRSLGVLFEKRVPPEYLRSSEPQRLAVLQGLMDTDGGWSTSQAEIALSDEGLADDAYELVVSLGMRASRSSRWVKGATKLSHRVTFSPTMQVFRLPRKAERYRPRVSQQKRRVSRYVMSVDPVESVPMRCITVDSSSHLYLAGRQMVPTHNSSASAVVVEEAFALGVQCVVFDRTGVYWGLRSNANGDGPGLSIYVLGGPHGDVPLEPHAGALIADLIVDSGHSFVLDLSDFSKSAAIRFAAELLERLYDRKARARTTTLLILDEAHFYAPQTPRGGFKGYSASLMGAMEDIVGLGRSRGLGVVLTTQRTQALNKAILDLIETLIVMRMLSPRARDAVQDWIREKHEDDREGVIATLDSLPTGTGWVWSPLRGVLQKIALRRIRTFDSYDTPKPGHERVEPSVRKELDLGALGEEMRRTAERAKENDPAELRRRLADAEGKVVRLEQERIAESSKVSEVVVEVPVLTDAQIAELQAIRAGFASALEHLAERFASATSAALDRLAHDPAIVALAAAIEKANVEPRAQATRPVRPSGLTPPLLPAPSPASDAYPTIKAGARRMLASLARLHPTPLTRIQLGTLSDISPSSGTYSSYKGTLDRAGLIAETPHGISLTPKGLAYPGLPVGAGAPPPHELKAMWESKLKAGARRMLQVLFDRYPHGVTRDELADLTEISKDSGTFSSYLSVLRRNNLAVDRDGQLYCGEALYLGSQR